MKYHISINQAQAAKICPDLDFNDLAIYDFIKSFATSGNCTTIYDGGKVYYWVSHAAIMDELPLLHIKSKTGIIARINKLVSAGILEKYVKCSDLGKSFYTFGSGAAMLETSTPPTQKNTPLQKNIDPPTKICRDPLQKNAGNYNINDNINKDNNNVVGFENPPTLTPDNIINVDVEEITGDPITVTTETITPPSSAAPPHDEANPNKKTLFRNSAAADRDTFFKTFGGDEYKTLDMEYYYQAVSDWSDSSNTKRTARGWFATVRTFIRGDKEKKRLHTKQQAQGRFNLEGAIRFLKNDFS